MVRNGKMMFLGMSAVTGMLAIWSSLAGCQPDTSSSTGDTTGSGGEGGSGMTTTTGANTGGASTTSTASSMTTTSSSSGGTGGSTAMGAMISDISTNKIGPGVEVKLTGVVAMSQKFLVSKGGMGSCLWGVFVSEPGLAETKPNSGILALSYGTNASIVGDGGTAFCPKLGTDPVGDAFPDDTKPGDVLDIVGETSYFLLSQCATQPGGSTVAQYQLSKVKPGNVVKTGTAPVPAAHKLTGAELAQIGASGDKGFHDKWGGVKIEINNVVSEPQDNAGVPSITNKFGQMLVHDAAIVAPTPADKIQVGDKLYFRAYLKSNFCHAGPVYPLPVTTFTGIEGFNYLDFCTWSVQPNNKCSDLSPPSPDVKDCNSKSDGCP